MSVFLVCAEILKSLFLSCMRDNVVSYFFLIMEHIVQSICALKTV